MIRICEDEAAVAATAAAELAAAASHAVAARGAFRLGLSGGTAPQGLYRRLAQEPGLVPWDRTTILFADERAVPIDHPDRNDLAIARTLLDALAAAGVRPRVEPMAAEWDDLESAARDYEAQLREPLDLLCLGVGADGHTASLFPGSAAAAEHERRVVAVWNSPKPPPRRLTITPRVIAEARGVLVIAQGAEKSAAVAAALDAATRPEDVPARHAREGMWIVDRAAAPRSDRA